MVMAIMLVGLHGVDRNFFHAFISGRSCKIWFFPPLQVVSLLALQSSKCLMSCECQLVDFCGNCREQTINTIGAELKDEFMSAAIKGAN